MGFQSQAAIGIRMALGAQLDHLLHLMMVDGVRPALFGLGLGLAVSLVATRIFQSMLFGTKPLDPVVLSGVIATLLAVAVLACLALAWRPPTRPHAGASNGVVRTAPFRCTSQIATPGFAAGR